MPAAPGPRSPVFDRNGFGRTAALLPPEEVEAYLCTLAGRAEALLRGLREPGASGADATGLAETAHAFAGSAGMFGFRRAADAARRFERACEDASPETPALAEDLAAALEASLGALRQRGSTAARAEAGQETCP